MSEFDELSNLNILGDQNDPEEHEEIVFHAPVVHQKDSSLDKIDQNSVDDYNYIRNVYLSLIENGQISLQHAIHELKASGHPRAAEVVGGLIKQVADVSTQLLDINQKIKGSSPASSPQSVTNQQFNFYGSPDDLLDVIEQEQEKNNEQSSNS